MAEKKTADKITVGDITKNCGYSPATFYRHFKDKYDLIAWDYAKGISQMMEQIGTNGYTWRQALMNALLQFQNEKEYLSNLLVHTGGHDSFIRYMSEIHCDALSAYVQKLTGAEELDPQTKLLIRTYCFGTACLNSEWILGIINATAAEIADIFEKSLPGTLQLLLI